MKGFLFNQRTQSKLENKDLSVNYDPIGFELDGEVVLSQQTSIAILRASASRLKSASTNNLETLAEALNHQPLALYLAGRFLQERWFWSYKRYMDTLAKTIRSIPAAYSELAKPGEPLKNRSLIAALLLSFQLLEGTSRTNVMARAIYQCAGYCAPDQPIPTHLLQTASGLDSTSRAVVFKAALNRLYELGFLTLTEDGPIVHERPAALARWLDNEEKTALTSLVDACIKICGLHTSPESQDGKFEAIDFLAPSLEGTLLLHFEMAAQHAEDHKKELSSQLWNLLGRACWSAQEQSLALYYFERGLRVDETQYGLLHAKIAEDCSLLGRVSHDMGDFRTARRFFMRAIMVTEKVFTHDYPGIAEDSVRLGRLLHQTGDLPGARAMFERALEIHEKTFEFGPRHPCTGSDLHQLGLVLFDMGLWQEAKKNFEQSLAVHKWVYGPQHATVIEDLTYLGKTLHAIGDLQAAKNCFEDIGQIEAKVANRPGYRSPVTLNNLGLVLQDLGSLDEARKCFERAMVIDEEILGLEHPDVARDVNNLSCVLREMGDLPAARMYADRAVAITEMTYGHEHHTLAVHINNLGRVLFAMQDFRGARECFERVLKIDEQVYSADHLELVPDAANLGAVLNALGEQELSREYFERAWDILRQALPSEHPRVINAQKLLNRLDPNQQT